MTQPRRAGQRASPTVARTFLHVCRTNGKSLMAAADELSRSSLIRTARPHVQRRPGSTGCAPNIFLGQEPRGCLQTARFSPPEVKRPRRALQQPRGGRCGFHSDRPAMTVLGGPYINGPDASPLQRTGLVLISPGGRAPKNFWTGASFQFAMVSRVALPQNSTIP